MPEATIAGRIMIRSLASGAVTPGESFRLTFSDDCCEGHALNSCQLALQGYLDWHNSVSLDAPDYQFFADEYAALEGPQGNAPRLGGRDDC